MGSTAHILVLGDAGAEALVARARAMLADLERAWSRFLPDSDISRLNDAGGRPVVVSPATVALLRRAVLAWHLTDGHFDPTVEPALVAAGYDRDFAALSDVRDRPAGPAPGELRAPGCAGIEVDAAGRRVRLPAGVRVDAGGTGKGLAADLVCAFLLRAGAAGALVNVGGDLRVGGAPPSAGGWVVDMPECRLRLAIPRGAVVTSSTLRRRWVAGGRTAHHVIDPASGTPAARGLVAATVVAPTAWWAEAVAKAVLVTGRAAPFADLRGAEVVAVAADGRRFATSALLPLLPGDAA
jgi:thiamine biosynthesis lipoprotein